MLVHLRGGIGDHYESDQKNQETQPTHEPFAVSQRFDWCLICHHGRSHNGRFLRHPSPAEPKDVESPRIVPSDRSLSKKRGCTAGPCARTMLSVRQPPRTTLVLLLRSGSDWASKTKGANMSQATHVGIIIIRFVASERIRESVSSRRNRCF